MNLHRTTGDADWTAVSPVNQTRLQRLARSTHGVVTPGNITTIIGLVLVGVGLFAIMKHDYFVGIGLVVVGRLCDLLDGWLAEKTATKSPLGELFDAAADKIGTIITILVLFVLMVAPWWLLVALIVPHVIIPLIAYVGRRRGYKIHPSRIGKLSMAVAWVGAIGLLILFAMKLSWPHTWAVMIDLLVITSAVMGLWAAVGYAKEIIK